ncbi:MAG: hypothetical protein AAGC60_20615 [Acidobacteriota bacterium]
MTTETRLAAGGACGDPFLRLAGDGILLTGDDSLQWLDRRGAHALRGKNLQHLHAALAPHLDGSRRLSELLAAVGRDKAGAVRSYLERLRAVGALVDAAHESVAARAAENAPSLEVDQLSAATPRAVVRCGRHRVHVSLLAEPLEPTSTSHPALLFLPPEAAVRWLAALRRLESNEAGDAAWHTLVVVPPAPVDEAELSRRAAVARWLLSCAAGPHDDLGRLQVFRLGTRGVSLERLAIARGRHDETTGLATLADSLGLLTSESVEQLPLTALRADDALLGVPLAPTPRPWHIGLTFDEVHAAALNDGLLALSGLATSGRTGADPAPTDRLVTARDRDTLVVALLEERARRSARARGDDGRRIDLLGVAGDDHVRCAQGLLATHRERLITTWSTTPEGATYLAAEIGASRSGDRTLVDSCSFFTEKAILELLLQALWHTTRAEARAGDRPMPRPALPAVAYDRYADAGTLRALSGGAPAASSWAELRSVEIWGHRLWFGAANPRDPG